MRSIVPIVAIVAPLAIVTSASAEAAVTSGCPRTGSTAVCTYRVDGDFVVPPHVTVVHVVAVGGHGAPVSCGAVESCEPGGRGAQVVADVPVDAGATLYVRVGGDAPARGWDGGQNGGGVGCGGGGGESDVRSGTGLATRLLVAGGGGGAGCVTWNERRPGYPTRRGGDAASAGASRTPPTGEGQGGQAGCDAVYDTVVPPEWCGHGGASGRGTVWEGFSTLPDLDLGYPGYLGHGGEGGFGPDTTPSGGGGGGGWYGGGGGGAGTWTRETGWLPGGGGGGGSSLIPMGGSVALDDSADPRVVISYEDPSTAASRASLSPTSLSFGSHLVGTTSDVQTVRLTNTGSAPLTISAVSSGGPDASQFATPVDGCSGTTLAPERSCAVGVTFSPTRVGDQTATLRFADDAADSPQTVTLGGAGRPNADIRTSVVASTGEITKKRTVTYTVSITNAGPTAASGVVLDDALSAEGSFVSITPSQGSCGQPAGGTVHCTLGALADGTTTTVRVVASPIGKKDTIVETATASSTYHDPDPTNNTASLTTRVR